MSEPVWLALDPDPVLAFLDLPASGTENRTTAVLICPPFGWEEMCSYRPRRRWAAALAEAGFPAARISLPSAGDGAGEPEDPDRVEVWTSAVSACAAWLRERTGAERVAIVGIGLGGLIACRAASAGAPIDDLILWAVPARGRMLVRELRAQAGVIDAEHVRDREVDGAMPSGALEAVGFMLSGETVAELEQVDLTATDLPRAADRRVLLLGRDRLGPDKRLRAYFENAGCQVSVEGGGDYEALIAHPQRAATPSETIAASVRWLQDGDARAGGSGGGSSSGSQAARAGHDLQAVEFQAGGSVIRERPLWLDLGVQRGFGVLSEPAEVPAAPVLAVLMNAGALCHTGPNRTWVEVARRWAARGVPTLRVDLEGIGETDGDDERYLTDGGLYTPRLTQQALALLDDLAKQGIAERFVVAGLCSGAYWALHAALGDPRVAGALLVNLFSFYWSAELVAERRTDAALFALRGEGWRRLARGDFNAAQVRRVIESLRPRRMRERKLHPVESAQSGQVDEALDRLRAQGTEVLLLLSEAEPLYAQFERQGRLEKLDRWPNLTVERYESRDHMFRALWVQKHVVESLDRGLERVLNALPASSA
jgi:alpha-beta hydrolase superfamily lysophospholipase